MKNGKKVIIFALLFLILASVSTFTFLVYQQKNQKSPTPTVSTFQEKKEINQNLNQEEILQTETTSVASQDQNISQNISKQNQEISQEELNIVMIDGNLVSLKIEENKLVLKKATTNEEITINLNQNTLYSRIFLSIDPTTKKGEVKKQENTQLSDLKEGDDLSVKISPDSETPTAELVRIILLEN